MCVCVCFFERHANSFFFFNRSDLYPQEAGKLTGMLLEMDKVQLVDLINNPKQLKSTAEEAIEVLREHTNTSLQ